MERVTLTTSDNQTIVGDYYPGLGSAGVLLLHMMPATRSSWQEFAPLLAGKGLHVLAIDLRGHGESSGGPEGYKEFSDEDHEQSIMDVEAGVAFLEEKGVKREELALMGASIGANLALWYAADRPEIRQVVLLSAGLDYHGIKTQEFAEKLAQGARVFFVSSQDDDGNADENRVLVEKVSSDVDSRLLVYENAGHGTSMFDKEAPDLAQEIITWLK